MVSIRDRKKLVDETGNPLKGLPAGSIRFAIAQLQPQANGSLQWRNYLTTLDKASAVGWGTHDAVQPTAETATAGTFTDNGDGSYTYKFSKNLDDLAAAAQAAARATLIAGVTAFCFIRFLLMCGELVRSSCMED